MVKIRTMRGFISLEKLQATGKILVAYEIVQDGTDKKPGLIGHGFGGEALICLLPDDDGQWFRDLSFAMYPDADVTECSYELPVKENTMLCRHCEKSAKYVCNFCNQPVCVQHAHIIGLKHLTCSQYDTEYGVTKEWEEKKNGKSMGRI